MRLNEVYTVVRESALMMNPLPTIAQGFSILIQEEKQREVRPPHQSSMESSTLNVGSSNTGINSFRTNYNQNQHMNASSSGDNSHRSTYLSNNNRYQSGSSSNNNRFQSNKYSQLFCDFCKKPCHIREICYRIYGFPINFKFTKGRNAGSAANVHGGIEEITSGNENHNNKGKQLSQEQYSQMVQLLENFQVGNATEISNNILGGAANFAGPLNEEAYGDL